MQVVATLAVVAYTVMAVTGCSGPASIVLGGGLALSSTAVAMQVGLPTLLNHSLFHTRDHLRGLRHSAEQCLVREAT